MKRALIIDDRQDNRYLLRTILEGSGWEVAEARHGAEALLLALENPPHLAISDLLMPVMDGFTLLRRWKADERLLSIPFVVYTATYTDPKDENLALEMGADAFILKPAAPEPFMARIREVVQGDCTNRPTRGAPPGQNQEVLLKEYNQILVRKLEEKALKLESANADLAIREAGLREAQSRLERAVSAGQVGLWDWDLETGQVSFSREWKEQIGYAEDEIGDKYEEWESRLHPEDRVRTVTRVREYLAGSVPVLDQEFRFRHKDGKYRHILARGSLVTDRSGRNNRLVGSHVDITDRVELQQLLVHAQKMESIGRLAAGVAHDFNNILTVIGGAAEMAREGLPQADPLGEELAEISKAVARGAALTRQLLTFSRREVATTEIIDLNRIVCNLEGMLRRLIETPVDIRLELEDDLGRVRADPGQIEQVIMNLAINGRDAITGRGTLTIATGNVRLGDDRPVAFSGLAPGEYVKIEVTDTGAGMSAEIRRRIFEPLFTTKAVGKGTGLGLSTVLGIVEQGGGALEVHSEPGAGTRIVALLPRTQETVVPEPAGAVSGVPSGGAAAGKHETVVIVETQESLRRLVRRGLEIAGFVVLTATSNEAALEILERLRGVKCLLVTEAMALEPGGDSLRVRVAERHPEVRILFTSDFDGDSLTGATRSRGVNFIRKPYAIADLVRAVRRMLDS